MRAMTVAYFGDFKAFFATTIWQSYGAKSLSFFSFQYPFLMTGSLDGLGIRLAWSKLFVEERLIHLSISCHCKLSYVLELLLRL